MATTSSINYVSRRNLKDIYPGLDSYDSKVLIYGWVVDSGSRYKAENCGLVTQLFADGKDLGSAESSSGAVTANGEWYYDSDNDVVYYYNDATNPQDMVTESGEDTSTLLTRIMKRASRMFESELDSRLSREVRKDREGNYPEYVIRAVGLKAIVMLLQSKDPENPVIDSFNEEYKEIIDGYRSGNIQMPMSVTADSSKGVIRDVGTISGAIRPVDTRGHYNGTFDILKVKITGAGIFGTSTYSVWAKNSDKLGIQEGVQTVKDQKITGDYQDLAYSMEIRFASSAKDSTASADDEWEIELKGAALPTSTSHVGSITLTRR